LIRYFDGIPVHAVVADPPWVALLIWCDMNNDKTEIGIELSRLIALQTEFFQKGNPTPAEIQEFERAGRRTRELFAQLAQLNKAA
jgi:hypothetical protein